MARIFVTGQCSLHWGRLEYGNIGNYYITEVLFRELSNVFPEAEIVTTFQMTKEFCERENIKVLPMDLFYGWKDDDLEIALKEFEIAKEYNSTGILKEETPYIKEVLKSDLIMEVSGEMWGEHADAVGKNRFLVGILKNRVAQLLGKKTTLFASAQGPFKDDVLNLAKETFENFSMVINREPSSIKILNNYGFNLNNTKTFACPAFLFDAASDSMVMDILDKEKIIDKNKKTVGFILCGFNMLEGPYDKKDRKDEEFYTFAETIEHIVNNLNCRVVLMSHSNGFELPPNFKLINGRDYYIIKQLYDVVKKRSKVDMNNVVCLEKPYLPSITKGIIKHFDMFVTGRVHASVAAISQNVPTVSMVYANGPKSSKMKGFFELVGTSQYVADQRVEKDVISKIDLCYQNLGDYRKYLEKRIPQIKLKAKDAFKRLKELVNEPNS